MDTREAIASLRRAPIRSFTVSSIRIHRAPLAIAVTSIACALVAGIAACGSFSATSTPSDGGTAVAQSDAPTSPCAAQPMTSWRPPRRMSELAGDGGEKGFQDPFVSADGLTLWVDRKAGGKYEVFRATRPSRSTAFGVLTRLPALDNPGYLAPYPSSNQQGQVLVSHAGIQSDLAFRAELPDGGYTLQLIDQRSDNEASPSVSADGTEVVFLHFASDGPQRFFFLAASTRTRTDAKEPWSSLRSLVEKGADGGAALPNGTWFDGPALTPDALGFFYEQGGHIYFVTRKARSAPFFTQATQPLMIPALDAADTGDITTRVRSITADGCEMYLTSNRDGDDDVYLAERGP